MTTSPADRHRALGLLEAADYARNAYYRDGLTVQEILTGLAHTVDRTDAFVASLARDGFSADEIAELFADGAPEVVPCVRPEPHPAHSHSGLRKGTAVHGRCPGVPAAGARQDGAPDDVVTELTEAEFHDAAGKALARLGLTYAELEDQARRRDFSSAQARSLWVTIGGAAPAGARQDGEQQ